MSDTTNASTNTDVTGQEENDNVETAGSDTQTALPTEGEKKFTQADLDSVIKRKQAEWREKYKREFDKALEGKRVLTEDELTTAINAAVTARETELALQNVKAAIKAEYQLSDEQVERLAGDDEKALRADAEKIFGAFKKKDAPNLVPGNSSAGATLQDDEDVIDKSLENAVKNVQHRRF
jgi:sugar-specific transcriptional regulator TrmB